MDRSGENSPGNGKALSVVERQGTGAGSTGWGGIGAESAPELTLRQVIAENADGILVVGEDERVLCANRAAVELFGRSEAALVGEAFGHPIVHGASSEIQIVRADGAERTVDMRVVRTNWYGARADIVSLRDVTARKQLEEQLRQAQKMEALGRLAGGIAHDFNNMLTSILCETSILNEEVSPTDPRRRYVDRIGTIAARAADLTNQLLTFSRRRVVKPEVLDVGVVLSEMQQMLRRMIGEDVLLTVVSQGSDARVALSRSQLEQVVMNLVINARDAMPEGGEITIETTRTSFVEPAEGEGEREFVGVTVRDTGTGMDESVLAHIFDPFFTTKPEGLGTGLGLSVVYGIVQQTGGRISVHSVPGDGTTFQVLLPRAHSKVVSRASEMQVDVEPVDDDAGARTILVAEDEEAIREVVEDILVRVGYEVLVTQDGAEAQDVFAADPGRVDLLITDVTMPRVDGAELAEAVLSKCPEMPILFLSGYPHTDEVEKRVDWERVAFLPKPFSPEKLVGQARKLLRHRGSAGDLICREKAGTRSGCAAAHGDGVGRARSSAAV